MRVRLLTGLTAAALLLAACGSSDDGDASATTVPATSAPATSAAGTTGTEGDESGDAATVQLATTDLGEILVDGDGNTLYMFGKDTKGQPSTCEGQCLEFWPPLVADGGDPVAGDGVDEALLSTIERSDGAAQVAYAGFPLYTYIEDTKPGDTTGQGVGGVWFVLDATGAPSNA
jgi:predicted lipoprotein with Yx(FWY)xxD motif